MGSLGNIREPRKSWILEPGTEATEPSNASAPSPAILVEAPITPSNVKSARKKDSEPTTPSKVDAPIVVDDPDELIQFSMRIKRSVAMRIYAEKFHDPAQRPIQEVVGEILDQGLARRPDKGPAPPSFIATYKSMGKKRKS